MAKRTYYELLGVSKTATETDIKQAYRKLAREYHPDVNSSADAEEVFKEINSAYATLSDSLKRADYDQTLADTGVRRGGSSAPRPQPGATTYADPSGGASAPEATYDTPYRRAMIRAALARVVAASLVTGLVGALLQIGLAFSAGRAISATLVFLGFVPAALLGALGAADLNFKVETFLGSGWVGRSYTFARTIVMSLALAYYGGLIGASLDRLIGGQRIFGPTLLLLGVLVGAVIGSDGDTPEKLRSGAGRFNLFYTFIRGAEVGVLGGLIGALLGLTLSQAGVGGMVTWTTFVGFALGMIVGSIKPPNLSAYASYASASVKNIIVILMVLAALGVGIGFGVVFQPQLSVLLGQT